LQNYQNLGGDGESLGGGFFLALTAISAIKAFDSRWVKPDAINQAQCVPRPE
jgi:hypothetical protein